MSTERAAEFAGRSYWFCGSLRNPTCEKQDGSTLRLMIEPTRTILGIASLLSGLKNRNFPGGPPGRTKSRTKVPTLLSALVAQGPLSYDPFAGSPRSPALCLDRLQAGGDLPIAIDRNEMHTVESFRVPDSLDQFTCDRHACSFVTINSADDGLGDRKLGDLG
jgi:hypothetical protein